ncbi:MAG: hypothetical protein VX938_10035, partial [Myxococcota bacterium]|nr:hypothetical protein [Myxococcota bacterium]
PHDKDPHELFEAIRAQSPGDEIIQVNHPRGSSLSGYFTYVGLDAETSQVVDEENWSLNWEVIEVFNGGCGGGEALQDWIGFTNNGILKTLGSGSDTHAESDPPGVPRNWIRIDEATVRENHGSLVPVVRDRSMFVSCGPFVRFEAIDISGETLAHLGEFTGVDDAGGVNFWARVEAPSWIQLDQALLWENGQVIESIALEPRDDPVVRLDTVFSVTPKADAWYALQVLGSGSLYPAAFGGPPNALTNPIEVDADGDGLWTPPNGGPAQER